MQSAHLSDVIILSSSAELIKGTSDHLKSKGATNITVHTRLDEAKEALTRFPRALLIADWDLGPEIVVPLLATNYGSKTGPLRSVLLAATQVSEALVAAAAEYSVSQIYADERTLKNLGPRLTALIMVEALSDDVKDGLAQAKEWSVNGDAKRGLPLLQDLLKKHPQNLRLKAETADLLIQLGRPEEGLKLLTGMDRTKPPYPRGVHLMGRALMRLGKFEEALQALEKASLFNPHDTSRLVEIGLAYLQVDEPQQAEARFDAALSLDPEVRDAKLGKSQCRIMEGDINEALEILREISGDVEKASLFNTCAVINIRQGRVQDALKLYAAALKAISNAPTVQARICFNIGLAYRRSGDKTHAKQAFEKSLALDPSFSKPKAQLAALSPDLRAVKSAVPPAQTAHPLTQKPFAPKSMDSLFAPISADSSVEIDAMLEEDLEKSPFVA